MIANACRVAGLALGIIATALVLRETPPAIPSCQEDAVLIGAIGSDFITEPGVRGGRFSAYVCGPSVDDYERIER